MKFEGKLGELLEAQPEIKALLILRCEACRLYVSQKRRDKARAEKARELEIHTRQPCPRCGRLVCKHQPIKGTEKIF